MGRNLQIVLGFTEKIKKGRLEGPSFGLLTSNILLFHNSPFDK
jgi:hypothetical protein